MAGSNKARKYVFAFSESGVRQSAFGVALDNADIDARHPVTSPVLPATAITRQQIRDCTGEYIIREDINSRVTRLTIPFEVTPHLLAVWTAFAFGAAANPTGTPGNEVQTMTSSASGGTQPFTFNFEGITETTPQLDFDASAAEVQAALENLRSIKKGNVTVSGTLSGGMTVTFTGRLAKANVPLISSSNADLTGGTISIVQTTAGANNKHVFSRTTADQHPLTSIILGFELDSTDPEKFKDVAVNTLTVNGTVRGTVTGSVEVICSADTAEALAYSIPACTNVDPVRTHDVRLLIDGEYVAADLQQFTYTYSNNISTGDDAFPFDDIDVARLEHGDRTSSFSFVVLGSRGDDLYTKAKDEEVVAVNLFVGRPGDRVAYIAPKAALQLAETPMSFVGDLNRSAINFSAVPRYDSGTAGTPDTAEAYIDQATAMLTT